MSWLVDRLRHHDARMAWEAELTKVREDGAKFAKQLVANREEDRAHSEVQGWICDLGKALGFDVWIVANDQNKP